MILAKLKAGLKNLKGRPGVDEKVWQTCWQKVNNGLPLTKNEGNSEHCCTFFVPFHRSSGSIYLVDHIKANDWIPPGGHIEPGESPIETVRREFEEELGMALTNEPISFFNLSIKQIDRRKQNCLKHFDLWHLVFVKKKHNFTWDRGEFHNAGWFKIKEGAKKIVKNPDYQRIVAHWLVE